MNWQIYQIYQKGASKFAKRRFIFQMERAELETGVLLVEHRDPSQGAALRSWLNAHVLPAISERILPFDTAVAQRSPAVLGLFVLISTIGGTFVVTIMKALF